MRETPRHTGCPRAEQRTSSHHPSQIHTERILGTWDSQHCPNIVVAHSFFLISLQPVLMEERNKDCCIPRRAHSLLTHDETLTTFFGGKLLRKKKKKKVLEGFLSLSSSGALNEVNASQANVTSSFSSFYTIAINVSYLQRNLHWLN